MEFMSRCRAVFGTMVAIGAIAAGCSMSRPVHAVIGSPQVIEVLPGRPVLGAAVAPAFAGDVHVTSESVYAGRPASVLARSWTGSGWSTPQVVVSGQNIYAFDADSTRIAVLYRDGSNRVDIFVRSGATWTLEQSIANALDGVTTHEVPNDLTIAADILIVGRGTVVFQRDAVAGQWDRISDPFTYAAGINRVLATDGNRVATCYSSCRTRVLQANGAWTDEAAAAGSMPPTNGNVLAVTDEWLFAADSSNNVAVWQRSGSQWLWRQMLAGPVTSLDADGQRVLVAYQSTSGVADLLQPDATGNWHTVAQFEGANARFSALSGTWLAVGGRTFRHGANGWEWAGYVERFPSGGSVFFGSQIVPVPGGVWISGPGSYVADNGSGAVWKMTPGASSVGTPIAKPSGPALLDGFGAAMASDSGRVAVLSLRSVTTPSILEDRVTFRDALGGEALPGLIVMPSYSTPPPQAISPYSTSVSMDGDLVVVARERLVSGAVSQVEAVIHSVDTAGVTVQLQTINASNPLPDPAFNLRAVPGANTELEDGWLMLGNQQYKRAATGQFNLVGNLPTAAGLSAGSEMLWRDAHRDGVELVIPVRGDTTVVGVVYRLDATNGWEVTGRVLGGGRAIQCLLAISGDRVACYAEASGLHFGDRQVPGDTWIFNESVPLPVTPAGIELGYRPATLRFAENTWYLGLPRISLYAFLLPGMVIAIPDGAAIFASGFD